MPTILDQQTDDELTSELGGRLRALRLQANVGIVDLAARSGLNRNTILNAEAGRNPRLVTIVRLLRALGRLDALNAFLPVPDVSPMALLEHRGSPRRRARRPTGPPGSG